MAHSWVMTHQLRTTSIKMALTNVKKTWHSVPFITQLTVPCAVRCYYSSGQPTLRLLSRVAVSPCPAMPCSPCKKPAFVHPPPFTHTQSLSLDDWATHTVPSDSQPWHHGEHSGYRVNMVSKLITHTTPFTTSLGVSISTKGCTRGHMCLLALAWL